MKKIITLTLVLALCLAVFTGCGVSTTAQAEVKEKAPTMFVEVEHDVFNYVIVYHKDTKVMYAISNGGYNSGTFTLLVNADGSPMVWEG